MIQCHDCAHFGPRACEAPDCPNYAPDVARTKRARALVGQWLDEYSNVEASGNFEEFLVTKITTLVSVAPAPAEPHTQEKK